VVVQFGKETSQTRDLLDRKNAALRPARPDPSLRKERWLRMTIKLHHYTDSSSLALLGMTTKGGSSATE